LTLINYANDALAQQVSDIEKKSSGLKARVISAVILAPPVLVALYLGGYFFDALALLITGLMAWEWCGLVTADRSGKGNVVFVLSSLTCVTFSILLGVTVGLTAVGGLLLVMLGLGRWFYADRAVWYAFGLPYVTLPMMALVWIREIDPFGMAYIVWLLLAVWATDIGAYFAGKGIGGPKIAPRISPNKTWAGLFGGMISSGIVAATVGSFFDLDTPIILAFYGAIFAIIAQVGDFFESWVKRTFNVKDASNLIPGHGGVLDRVDGVLTVAVALWAILSLKLIGGVGA